MELKIMGKYPMTISELCYKSYRSKKLRRNDQKRDIRLLNQSKNEYLKSFLDSMRRNSENVLSRPGPRQLKKSYRDQN
jgi:hypothetical protein